MALRILLTAVMFLVAAACGSADLPTQPTPPQTVPSPVPPGVASIEGEYVLTLTAAPGCTLPVETMRRTYTATIREPGPGHVIVTLSGAVFRMGLASFTPGFLGTRDGDVLQFSLGAGGAMGVAEEIDSLTNLYYTGSGSATIGDPKITGTFSGQIYVWGEDMFDCLGECTATDHRIEFVRR
jgi:hypothetical protein